ncbi:hypothetical protein So717_24660 [Roseobacter cerasinus]|uniref:Glycosyltransferase 61 catalytic domain-containing protein n=1 Tax=Roseobacter cerasinus TaxID=2602289 RepID=A0A640VR67_9RHOB|nr:hypothetical protein So717_24660 [Roseobacter cerasinus]
MRRAPVLFVTFDNLGSVGEYDPPQPWLHMRVQKLGFSILGLIARRKDWYRNADTPMLLTCLQEAGFFEQFERVIFTGTSMGGYAALTYSRLVPGAEVAIFSPQTTLNQQITPFEARFKYALRKWDWDSPAFLDATEAVPKAARVLLFYDPFVPEDRAHAQRLLHPNVTHVKCRHFGHRALRQVKACGVLEDLFGAIGAGTFEATAFVRSLSHRRNLRPWRKALLSNVTAARHPQLAKVALERLQALDPDAVYLEKARTRLEKLDNPRAEQHQKARLNGRITTESRAIVVPERPHDTALASGVLLAGGRYCAQSRTWIRATKFTPPPTLSNEELIDTLAGNHLFAGHLRGHFGHFLVESTARLWALAAVEGEIDSVLYLPYRGKVRKARRALKALSPFFDQLELSVPVKIIERPTQVETLHIPELGFGWGERYAGTPDYRHLMRNRLGRRVKAEGAERLYISRARLPPHRGGVLGEHVIEANLARQGYEIFHPELHPLEVQIARYKAARQVVALDGSALHLAAFFLPPAPRVCLILRRSRANAADYIRQYEAFCDTTPDVIDVISKDWLVAGSKRVDFRSVGQLDFGALFDQLKALHYVDRNFAPDLPDAREIEALEEDLAARGSRAVALPAPHG